jgi:hypothetical protein
MTSVADSKKRGRKKKDEPIKENVTISVPEPIQEDPETALKKRGRKPKGGKLIQKTEIQPEAVVPLTNVILHLRCSLKDLDIKTETMKDPLTYNPDVPPDIMSYQENPTGFAFYVPEETSVNTVEKPAYIDTVCKKCSQSISNEKRIVEGQTDEIVVESADDSNIKLKDIHQKLKKLRVQFYKNSLNDKKSACFWCTYDFDNEPCYIPKHESDDTVCGYGCFCRPECAVGYLMKESINDSTKFERYQLLNQIYSKVYGFKKNIKPAPSPYYLLDKFYGSLSIQEYRKLLKTEHMLLVLDKPLTRILPELHDDNDEFILNIYGGVKTNQGSSSGQYKVKRQSEKAQGPTKSTIMKEKFNMV